MSERCPEAYKVMSMPTVGLRRAHCPNCGRIISFHWATGRFANHNVPAVDLSSCPDVNHTETDPT